VETRTLLPIEGLQCADRGSEPVGGGWDNHQILAFIWAHRPSEQVASNQARKARESLNHLIQMGVLLCRSSAGKQVLATLEWCHVTCYSEAQTCH
jgi:hypothetical protein